MNGEGEYSPREVHWLGEFFVELLLTLCTLWAHITSLRGTHHYPKLCPGAELFSLPNQNWSACSLVLESLGDGVQNVNKILNLAKLTSKLLNINSVQCLHFLKSMPLELL